MNYFLLRLRNYLLSKMTSLTMRNVIKQWLLEGIPSPIIKMKKKREIPPLYLVQTITKRYRRKLSQFKSLQTLNYSKNLLHKSKICRKKSLNIKQTYKV